MSCSIGSFKEVMVYGYACVRTDLVKSFAHDKIERVYNYDTPCKSVTTLSGRAFTRLPLTLRDMSTLCKNTLVVVVRENYLRKKESIPIIPLIFCLESTEYGSFPAASIANKNLDKSPDLGKVSKTEIRRMYKLCSDPELSAEVKQTAQETFKFVRVKMPNLELEEIPAPWEKEPESWVKAWELKKATKSKSKAASAKLDWKSLLKDPEVATPKNQTSSACLIQ